MRVLMLVVVGKVLLLLLLPGLARKWLLVRMGHVRMVGCMAMEVIWAIGRWAGVSCIRWLWCMPMTSIASQNANQR